MEGDRSRNVACRWLLSLACLGDLNTILNLRHPAQLGWESSVRLLAVPHIVTVHAILIDLLFLSVGAVSWHVSEPFEFVR